MPGQNVVQLAKAIAFLAGALAASADQLAAAVPELASDLGSACREGPWLAAAERAAELWMTRHTRGEVNHQVVPATVIFVGSKLVTVDADGVRLTFRFDTRAFDRSAPVSVSGCYLTPAGTRKATQLAAGSNTWTFDLSGTLVQATDGA